MYLKLRKYCNFGAKNFQRAWHVIPSFLRKMKVNFDILTTRYLIWNKILLVAWLASFTGYGNLQSSETLSGALVTYDVSGDLFTSYSPIATLCFHAVLTAD